MASVADVALFGHLCPLACEFVCEFVILFEMT